VIKDNKYRADVELNIRRTLERNIPEIREKFHTLDECSIVYKQLVTCHEGEKIRKNIVPLLCETLTGKHKIVKHKLISQCVRFLNYGNE
jgi:hypothetical protein